MSSLLAALDAFLRVLRPVLFALAVVLALVCFVDWLVRTRRLNPFGGVARFFRASISPLMEPVERRVVRSGGLPSSAPWWTLAGVVLGGIVVLSLMGFLRGQLVSMSGAMAGGSSGIFWLLVGWTFALLRLALLVRVFSSFFRVSPYSRWIRWSYLLSEPMLRPLRQIVPTIGMFDITPVVAYLLLGVFQSLVHSVA